MARPTHIIKQYPSNDAEILFRASDGMMIGMREKVTVIYGDDPNKRVSRLFIDSDFASRYLRNGVVADATFEIINEEENIIQPGSAFVVPGGGSIHRMS